MRVDLYLAGDLLDGFELQREKYGSGTAYVHYTTVAAVDPTSIADAYFGVIFVDFRGKNPRCSGRRCTFFWMLLRRS
jgi:hypothetical protein